MSVKVVLFDFGDTLVSTDPSFNYEEGLIQFHHSLTENKIVIPYEDFKRVHLEIRDKVYHRKRPLREVTFCCRISRALRRFGYNLSPCDERIVEAAEAFMQVVIKARRINRDVHRVLRKLRSRYRLGVVSNYGYTPAVLRTLEKFDLTRFFDVVIVSADVGWRKPDRRIFEAALKALGVSASETVFVGDSLDHDIVGARKAGMRTVLLLPRTWQTETSGRVRADRAIKSLRELPELLLGL